ncbi:MAG: type II secretion system minor pseudopilin GspJ [Sulfurifustaceae bacterium]
MYDRSRGALRARSLMSGFTLLEILVAVAVFAIFSAMAYGGLMRLLDNRERIEAERAYWRELSLAFIRLEQDFSLARNRDVRDSDGSRQPAFKGQPTDPRALADPNVEFTRGGILVANGSTADLQRVGYRFVDGKVMRITWPVLDRAPLTKPVMTPLLLNVDEFEVRFFQANPQSGTSTNVPTGGWVDRWPPLAAGSNNFTPLPRAVQVTLSIKGRGKYKRVFLVGDDK